MRIDAQELLEQRDRARDIAVTLEAQLARLTACLMQGGQDGESTRREAIRILFWHDYAEQVTTDE